MNTLPFVEKQCILAKISNHGCSLKWFRNIRSVMLPYVICGFVMLKNESRTLDGPSDADS